KKQEGVDIDLTFTHDSEQPFSAEYICKNNEIKSIATKNFDFLGEKFTCYLFSDLPPKNGIVAMLCADRLSVEVITLSKKFDSCRYSIFITSDYFNRLTNIERQKLEIPKDDTNLDWVSPISREKLFPEIAKQCMTLVEEFSASEIKSFQEKNISILQKYYPYINTDTIGGDTKLFDADEIINKHRKSQAKQEDRIIDKVQKGTASIGDMTHLASGDLAKYIVHRALVIDSLTQLPIQSQENEIHNAFLPKNSNGAELYENNIWLLDDKFLSYSNIFSDKQLKNIVDSINPDMESDHQRRPDIAIFFTKDNTNQPNKLVIIEFKKLEADIYDNSKSLAQCRLYATEIVKKIDSIREVFAFAIVEVNDEFYELLIGDGFTDIFSMDTRIVYRDYKIKARGDMPFHQYVMPINAILKDAKARNKVFEDILKLGTT
ncbi:MAG: hypothetical protein KGM99_19190, partial [Burkholderiales bacterium]|nr:hypothetical protein [Burkholderiales bacterium]